MATLCNCAEDIESLVKGHANSDKNSGVGHHRPRGSVNEKSQMTLIIIAERSP